MNSAVFVINLDPNSERMSSMKKQLDALGVPYSRFEGTRGSALDENALLEHYSPKINYKCYYRPLTRGEIGIYFSNLRLWQRIVDDDLDYAISLEDDILLGKNFPDAIKAIEKINIPWDCIKLGNPGKKKRVLRSIDIKGTSFRLARTSKPPTFCVGQAISNSGARKLLKTRAHFGRPVDVDLQWFWENGLKIYSLLPECVSLGEESFQSTKDVLPDPPEHHIFAKPAYKLRYMLGCVKSNIEDLL